MSQMSFGKVGYAETKIRRQKMINSKSDLKYYLEMDKKALGKTTKNPRLFGDEIWRYQRALRMYEYYLNCRKAILFRPLLFYFRIKHHLMGILLGFTIPANVFGPGLHIAHRGTIVVSGLSRIGSNCLIHTCVNIGQTSTGVPVIGDNVHIGPGAKLYGGIELANGIRIGANAVVNKSFTEPDIIIAGVPAKRIISQRLGR